MGVLQEIYKKYTGKYNFDASGDYLGIIRKLILSNNRNEDLCVNNECRIEYHGHTYTYCVMDDEDICSVPKNFDTYDFFEHEYHLCGQCHVVTASYLEKHQHPRYSAVTSLCYGDGSYFFHSYIWDRKTKNIYDFSRNIIMPKEQYDEVFVCREINVLSYEEYVDNLCYYEYMLCGEDYCRLMYLALIKLYEEEMNADLPECEYPRKYVGDYDFPGIIGRTFNRH